MDLFVTRAFSYVGAGNCSLFCLSSFCPLLLPLCCTLCLCQSSETDLFPIVFFSIPSCFCSSFSVVGYWWIISYFLLLIISHLTVIYAFRCETVSCSSNVIRCNPGPLLGDPVTHHAWHNAVVMSVVVWERETQRLWIHTVLVCVLSNQIMGLHKKKKAARYKAIM